MNQVRNYFGQTVYASSCAHVTLVECIILRGSCFHGFLMVPRCSRNWSADSSTLPQRLHGWCKLSAGAATPMLKQSYIYYIYMIIYNNKSWKNNDMLIPCPQKPSISAWASLARTKNTYICSGTPGRALNFRHLKKIYPHVVAAK